MRSAVQSRSLQLCIGQIKCREHDATEQHYCNFFLISVNHSAVCYTGSMTD